MTEVDYNMLKRLQEGEIATLKEELQAANDLYNKTMLAHEITKEELDTEKKISEKIEELKSNINVLIDDVLFATNLIETALRTGDTSISEDSHAIMETIHNDIL